MVDTLEEFIQNISHYDAAPRIGYRYWSTRDLDLVEVAKLIRKEIAEWRKSPRVKPWKVSVRVSKYTRGGGNISVKVEKTPGDAIEWASVRLHLQYILDSYNYNASHSMYDYYNSRYGTDIDQRT